MRQLSHTQVMIWLVLFRDARNGVARASQKWIAERCGVTDRTVRRQLPLLEARGLVEVKSKGGLGRGPSAYIVRALPAD
ncbi:helix-turn-helix domain-containing protein [Alienimonas californiensis]|nr:helix-turn-helix domain-containing protein [Alienimonas californiensis]